MFELHKYCQPSLLCIYIIRRSIDLTFVGELHFDFMLLFVSQLVGVMVAEEVGFLANHVELLAKFLTTNQGGTTPLQPLNM